MSRKKIKKVKPVVVEETEVQLPRAGGKGVLSEAQQRYFREMAKLESRRLR